MLKIFQHMVFIILLGVIPQKAFAESLKINGSSTVTSHAFKLTDQAAIKSALDVDFEVITSNSGRGVLALINDQADIAMISSDLETVAAQLKNRENIDIALEDYTVSKLAETKIDFIVNPSNPLTSITKEQAKNLLDGTLTSWKDLGLDKDPGPLKIVTEHPTGGMYSVVKKRLTPETGITKNAVNMQNGPQVAIVVSQVSGSFGFISQTTSEQQRKGTKTLTTDDFEMAQHMYFVTKKADTRENVASFIAFMQDQYGRSIKTDDR